MKETRGPGKGSATRPGNGNNEQQLRPGGAKTCGLWAGPGVWGGGDPFQRADVQWLAGLGTGGADSKCLLCLKRGTGPCWTEPSPWHLCLEDDGEKGMGVRDKKISKIYGAPTVNQAIYTLPTLESHNSHKTGVN